MSKSKDVTDCPLVSIVTPVLNGIKYLETCVQSVLNQSYPHIEHVFCDGASSDGTVEMLSDYNAKHPDRIRFISEPDSVPGTGMGEAWNKGLKIAKGDILGWLGADDMLFGPDAIHAVVEFFRLNPNASFVHGGCNYIDEKGEIFRTHEPRDFILKELINDGNFIAFPSAFYRKSVVERVGWADAYGNDYDYIIRIAKAFPIHRTDKVLSNFRIHPGSETASLAFDDRVRRLDYLVVRRHGAHLFSKNIRRYYLFVMLKKLSLLSLYYFMSNLFRKR